MVDAADCDATEALFNGATVRATLYLTSFSSREPVPTHGSSPRACFARKRYGRSRPGLPGAVDAVFEAGQLFRADRAAGMEFTGGDADFGTEAEFAAVGEL